MAEAGEAMLAGLPDQARRLLAEPPAMEKRLIELSVSWPGQTGGLARMAAAGRLFVITWDPLAGMVERPGGFATTNGGSADLEIVVYLPVWSLVRAAATRNNTLPGVIGAWAGSATVTASRHEDTVNAGRYPDLAVRGAARISSPRVLETRQAIEMGNPSLGSGAPSTALIIRVRSTTIS
jgi:hypothetical protein